MKREKNRTLLEWTGSILFYLTLVVVLIVTFLFMKNDDPKKTILGYRVYHVKTSSMDSQSVTNYPQKGFQAGALIVVKNVTPEKLKIGDVVTIAVEGTNAYLTHRIIEVQKQSVERGDLLLITKGDANSTNDQPVHVRQVVGKVTTVIPPVSKAITFAKDHVALMVSIIAGLLVVIILLKVSLQRNKKSI